MKSLVLALILLFVGCGGGCGGLASQRPSGTQGIQYTPELVKDSVFRLDATLGGMPFGTATVWKVAEGYGVTAGHVCINDGPGIAFFARDPQGQPIPLHVLKTNDPRKGEPDLCVMTGDLPGAALDRIGEAPSYGDPLFYSGAPQGVAFPGLQPYFEGRALNPGYMAIAWAQGASGSPVYTRNGVVGVLVAGFMGTQISAYVPVAELDKFLKGV